MRALRLGFGLLGIGIFVGTGCGSDEGTSPHATTGGAAGASARGGAAGASLTAGGGQGGRPFTCAIDNPCPVSDAATCVGTTQIQKKKQVGCQEACHGAPCSGFQCVDAGPPQDCPEGTRCRSHGTNKASCDPFDPNSGIAGAGDTGGESGVAGAGGVGGAGGVAGAGGDRAGDGAGG